MKKKFLKISQKIIAATMLILICGTNVAHAALFDIESLKLQISGFLGGMMGGTNGGMMGGMTGGMTGGSYGASELKMDLSKFQGLSNLDMSQVLPQIEQYIGKLGNVDLKEQLSGILDSFKDLSGSGLNLNLDLSGLLDTLMGVLGGSTENTLPVQPTQKTITSNTAYEFTGDAQYKVKLSANVYKHVDANGKEDSKKWALLIHPFLLNGKMMANSVGPMYYERGYNIIAIDLRGFGDSEGSVAIGFLEGLDAYDWLCYLKDTLKAEQIIVHGVSLGAATTNYVSGIDQFMEKAPENIRMNKDFRAPKDLGVIGFVEDCGYYDMAGFAGGKDLLLGDMLKVGLTEKNFDYYGNAKDSLRYCNLPYLIIHGDGDTTVKPAYANDIEGWVKENNPNANKVTKYIIKGGQHANVIIGIGRPSGYMDGYTKEVQDFIIDCDPSNANYVPVNPPVTQNPDPSTGNNTNGSTTNPGGGMASSGGSITEWITKFTSALKNALGGIFKK